VIAREILDLLVHALSTGNWQGVHGLARTFVHKGVGVAWGVGVSDFGA